VEKGEDEFKYLSRVAKNVLCVPITNVSIERECSVARLVVKEYWTSFSSASVDSILLLYNMMSMAGRRFNLAVY
jgi:hypothetical protein